MIFLKKIQQSYYLFLYLKLEPIKPFKANNISLISFTWNKTGLGFWRSLVAIIFGVLYFLDFFKGKLPRKMKEMSMCFVPCRIFSCIFWAKKKEFWSKWWFYFLKITLLNLKTTFHTLVVATAHPHSKIPTAINF